LFSPGEILAGEFKFGFWYRDFVEVGQVPFPRKVVEMVPKNVLLWVLLVGWAALFVACGEVKPLPADGSGDDVGAWVAMQMFVEDRLKSPATADFPWGAQDQVKDLGGGRYFVDSYVDSENSFGANVRTRFKGYIRKENERWVLESLELGEFGLPAPTPQDISKNVDTPSQDPPPRWEAVIDEPAEDAQKLDLPMPKPAPKPMPNPEEVAEVKRQQERKVAIENEKKAAGKMRLALQLLKKGETNEAKDWLAGIVRDFPNTEAAKQAQAKLDAIK
jgi:hypothetical protein